jgi:hypothetical protein
VRGKVINNTTTPISEVTPGDVFYFLGNEYDLYLMAIKKRDKVERFSVRLEDGSLYPTGDGEKTEVVVLRQIKDAEFEAV